MHVVATAGHVDHGKSTLVRRLTGMEPDRWEEERRRGLTIDLGYAWTTLPVPRHAAAGHAAAGHAEAGHAEPAEVAFVDVPGHERFVANMLAGVGPVPAVLFVVAADGGWMPQSAEHLGALDALGVEHGLLAVTRSDLADPAPATERALREIAATSLGTVEAVAVSGATGAGLEDLRAALGRLVTRLPAPDRDAPVRLWADRSFTVRGSGTVVTGTLAAGTLREGDELVVAPGGRRVRARGLQSLGRALPEVPAVARVAVNLRGLDRHDVRRGDALLTPGAWIETDVLDVRLRPAGADLPREAVFHVGAAAVTARLRPLDRGLVRLTLRRPLPLRVGDRALLRDPGRHAVVAGVTVLDVRPPDLDRRGAAAARARALATADGRAEPQAELRRRGIVRAADLRAMGVGVPVAPGAAGWLVDPARWAALRPRLAEVVTAHLAAAPLESGPPLEAVRQRLGLPDVRLVEALVAPPLMVRDGRVVPIAAAGALPPRVAAAVEEVARDLAGAPFRAPEAQRLADLGLGSREQAAADRAGRLLRLADGVVLLPGADREAARLLAALPQPFTVSDARRALDTSRRVALPLLDLLDRRRLTRRLPDDRREVTGA